MQTDGMFNHAINLTVALWSNNNLKDSPAIHLSKHRLLYLTNQPVRAEAEQDSYFSPDTPQSSEDRGELSVMDFPPQSPDPEPP